MAVTQSTLERAFRVGFQLLQSGTLDCKWLDEYHIQLAAFDTSSDGKWCAEHFGLLHFVSVYLPSRYLVACKSSGQNLDTERALTRLVMTTEQTLWNALASAPLGALRAHERVLPGLVFGLAGEVAIDVRDHETWASLYQNALSPTAFRWKYGPMWTAWEAMSLHFVSLYQDLMVTGQTDSPLGDCPVPLAYDPNLPRELDRRTQACIRGRMKAMQGGEFYSTWSSLQRDSELGERRGRTETAFMLALMHGSQFGGNLA